MVRAFEKTLELPYGENPHQRAAYYAQVGARTHVLSMVSQLGGKPLSFNNLLDLDAARLLGRRVPDPRLRDRQAQQPLRRRGRRRRRWRPTSARSPAIPLSAYGGVICFNRRVDRELAEALTGQFIEVLFARGYDDEALEALCVKPNLRILDDRERRSAEPARALPAPGDGRDARPGSGRRPRGAGRHAGRLRAPADRGRVGGDAVRLAGVQARALERDRALQGAGERRHRRRADEPGRLGADRDREGADRS